MRRTLVLISLVALFLAGCSLAEDVTPPPGLATAQAARLDPAATSQPLLLEPKATSESSITVVPVARTDPQVGEAIYEDWCAGCHGLTGLGDGEVAIGMGFSPPSLGEPGFARQIVPSEWYSVVTQGRMDRFMPPFTNLDDDQRWDVVAYALNLSTSSEEVGHGNEVFAVECAACHGADGRGQGAIPDLTKTTFLVERSAADLYNMVTGGVGQGMPSFGASLSEDDRWAVATYVRSLGFPIGILDEPILEAEPQVGTLGVVHGTIRNASESGVVPMDLEITLHGLDGQQEVIAETTLVGHDSEYLFEDLEIVPGRLFFVTFLYKGVAYQSTMAHLTQSETMLELPVTIYETTNDANQVSVDRLHLLFEFPNQGVIRVVEMWVLSNRSDRMLVSQDGGAVVQISLPLGATDLRFEQGAEDSFSLTEHGFAYISPLMPGMDVEQLNFSFDMPYEGQLAFRQVVSYPVEAVVVLLPEDGVKVQGDGLQDQSDLSTVEGMDGYTIGPLSAGDILALNLSGRPTLESEDSSLSNVAIGVGALGVALIVVGLWWCQVRGGGGILARVRGKSDYQALLRAIAALDNDFEAGEISEVKYRRRRERLKRQALDFGWGDDD